MRKKGNPIATCRAKKVERESMRTKRSENKAEVEWKTISSN